jgi:tetratricopeptide (TPR) repeat protein
MDGKPNIHSDDFYVVLGVSKTASPEEIKRAYLALVREYTPERSPAAFQRIRQAYETLSDPTARGQYDTRPDPQIAALVNRAAEAMRAQEYSRAEQLYKQALLEAPQLAWIRNLLGICFLYQNRPRDAIEQYERLLQQPTIDASMHANLAHAYRMVRRYDDAEREFRVAMSLAGDHGFEYGLALLEMIADRGEVDAADRVVQQLIAAAPPGSRAAAAYYAKQIELALRAKRRPTIPAILVRMTQGLNTDDEKHIVAGTLGNVAGQVLAGGVFDVAERIAQTAGKLVPDDPGFDGLEQAARLLGRKDLAGVARLLRTHVAFAPGGVLQGLRPVIERHLAAGAAPTPVRPQPRRVASASSGRLPWVLVWFLVMGISRLFTDSNSSSQAGTPYPMPATPVTAESILSTSGNSAALFEKTRKTEYVGILTTGAGSGKPVRAHMRVTFDDLKTSTGGYLTVSPPLSGSGPCLVRAHADSVRLTVYAGSDTLALVGARVADTIYGSYRPVGADSSRRSGQWRAWLVSGARLPARLNPW